MNTKYITEGGLDFFSELYKSLDIAEDAENKIDESNLCLITQEKLTDKYIELKCGHKFNYIALYNDLVNFKKKFNLMEGINTRLDNEEIRCPYCREKQSELLPYYEELGLEKINGVNFYDVSKNNFNYNKCEFLFLNLNFNYLKPETNDNKKFIQCKGQCATKLNIYNLNNPNEVINYGDNKLYCYIHKKQMIKQYYLEEKIKIKQKVKEEKELIKQKLKEEKELIKQKVKESKKNIIIQKEDLEDKHKEINKCIEILKTGQNKGNKCTSKIYLENLCKRHYILKENKY